MLVYVPLLVLATKLGGLTQQSFILLTKLPFGQGSMRMAVSAPHRAESAGAAVQEVENLLPGWLIHRAMERVLADRSSVPGSFHRAI